MFCASAWLAWNCKLFYFFHGQIACMSRVDAPTFKKFLLFTLDVCTHDCYFSFFKWTEEWECRTEWKINDEKKKSGWLCMRMMKKKLGEELCLVTHFLVLGNTWCNFDVVGVFIVWKIQCKCYWLFWLKFNFLIPRNSCKGYRGLLNCKNFQKN